LSGHYGLMERFTLSGNFSYLKDTTLDSELEETGLVTLREDRERYTGGGGISYRLSERSDVGLDYSYRDTRYDARDLSDYDSHGVTLSYNRYFNDQRDIFTIQPYYTHWESDTSEADNCGLSLGLVHGFSETLRLTAFVGARYTRTEQVVPTPWWILNDETVKDSNWGGVADVAVTKTNETTSITLGYSRDLYFDSQGEPIETDRFRLSTNRQITRRLGVGFYGTLYFTESEGEYQFQDSRHVELSPSFNYKITREHTLGLGYSYAHHDDKTLSENEKYDRHRGWIVLHFKFPQHGWL
ncbi:MAG: hypothetical protein SWE60_16365, partial [Thermodesulfobacteriota bacterium]|nr:hypothetical protein [Thermodesulfobacteriota bacterium]